ncbi:MAG: hypothetical protein U5K79_11815 [Cyclobacteriaceae bacterium]|nr:hypothetical protein [Cyclobacteriaceae bacterium]
MALRWSIDTKNQGYNELEQAGFESVGIVRTVPAGRIITKGNQGHSTLTVNDTLFVNTGHASLLDFKNGTMPESTFDLTPLYGENLKKATRRFVKDSPCLVYTIEDRLEVSPKTQSVTWQMLTQADVEIVEGGAILRQDGKVLKLQNISHPNLAISVISLYPAPMALNRQMENLKRIEIRMPAWTIEDGHNEYTGASSAMEIK